MFLQVTCINEYASSKSLLIQNSDGLHMLAFIDLHNIEQLHNLIWIFVTFQHEMYLQCHSSY